MFKRSKDLAREVMSKSHQERSRFSPLLLRFAFRYGRGIAKPSQSEGGYSLAVALIAAFVLLLGVAALASRTNFGFIGQVFQGQNRQARDVAESAIAQFASAMNREENRYLLIAGDTGNWGTLDSRNVCTVYDNAGGLIGSRRDTEPNDYTPADTNLINRFRPNNGAQQLEVGDASRTFTVEDIEFRRADATRTEYGSGTPGDTNPASDWVYRQNLKRGDSPALIRITVVGSVNQNNRASTARIAKEFEVVPKCCKRSFGAQAAQNLGRDRQACSVEAFEGGRGLIIGLNGGGVNRDRRGGGFDIRDERGLVTQALCWGGSPPNTNEPSDLNPNADTSACTGDPPIQLGQPRGQGTGITFSPEEFDLLLPRYAKESPDDYLATLNTVSNPTTGMPIAKEVLQWQQSIAHEVLNITSDQYIYYDSSVRNLRICDLNGTGISNCRPLALSGSNDVCYERISAGETGGARRPYVEVNCRLSSIDPGNGNRDIYIDTSNARINFFFDDPALTDDDRILGARGNIDFIRVHCSWDTPYTNYGPTSRCQDKLPWLDPSGSGRDFQAVCDSTGSSPCGLVDSDGTQYKLDYYDISELLNFYILSKGALALNGTSETVGFNVYAPQASVSITGGGNADPNFMGRLWVNSLALNGGGTSLAIRVPSTGPSFLDDGSGLFNTLDYWDFIVRSFTQSSGFGL